MGDNRDIVERLLSRAWDDRHHRKYREEAAAEITRLRAEVERLNLSNQTVADELGAEIDRLLRKLDAARAETFERAAQISEDLPVLRPISTAHVKATTPKDVASAIRQAARGESGT